MNSGRERLGSRLGFILLSAGCAIGCGNVWKFPYLAGEYGGGAFVLIYFIFLVILGIPVMTIEFSLGRAAQKSPMKMLQTLEPKGSHWGFSGWMSLAGNLLLMMFYTTVGGWFLNYFVNFTNGSYAGLDNTASGELFSTLLSDPGQNIICMFIVCLLGFLVCSFELQRGLERVTKYMMLILFALIIALAIHSFTLSGASEGLSFYLKPDFSKVTLEMINAAMNQAFFTLSLGIGSMAIFGSYINKDRSLMGESLNVIVLDTSVAIIAGLIIFPACFTYDIDANAGPSLIFETLPVVFNNMPGGRIWGALFFLFMTFAAFSTILAVFENILAMIRDLTGWSRRKGCIICGVGMFILSIPCALGFNLWSGFEPFGTGTSIQDLEDFLVSNCLLPFGCLIFVLFITLKKGWGWDNFMKEANEGKGLKVKSWMRPYIKYVLPVIIAVVLVIGLITFNYSR